ncbi:Fasciclin-like arabinogalactan protein 11 [Dionaea muscipula]
MNSVIIRRSSARHNRNTEESLEAAMNSQHHASLGRPTLEEIRLKRAAKRLSKASFGSDLSTASNTAQASISRSDSHYEKLEFCRIDSSSWSSKFNSTKRSQPASFNLEIEMRKMQQQKDQQLLLLLLTFLLFVVAMVCAQAPAPTPPGPTNITAILVKSGQYTTFIRLLQSTQIADQINTQLNNSNQGLTVLAPTDNAFANLKPGTLNSLTDQQKVELVQFHILPTFLSIPQFQTVSNPLRTQAGNSNSGAFPLNVTTAGNQVNITTGVVNTTVANTVYTDNQLAVYQVDQVLLPLQLFGPPAPASAPAPSSKPKKSAAKPSDGSLADTTTAASSNAIRGSIHHVLKINTLFGVAAAAAAVLMFGLLL